METLTNTCETPKAKRSALRGTRQKILVYGDRWLEFDPQIKVESDPDFNQGHAEIATSPYIKSGIRSGSGKE